MEHLERKYAVVIDAGSSGSRVHIYSWRLPDTQRARLPSAEWIRLPAVELGNGNDLRWQYKQEPGLSSFAGRSQLVHEHLTPLMNFAKEVISPNAWAATPVYLFATAGMRLVAQPEQGLVLDAVCRHLQSDSPFQVIDCHRQIKVISGETEGVYGWVAVNVLLGGFEKQTHKEHHISTNQQPASASPVVNSAPGHTLGFLDMGGASTQLVFEPSTLVADEHRHDITEVRLRRLDGSVARHDVFVTTFLGYGTNQARSRYVELLLKEHPNATTPSIHDPCLPNGLHEQVDSERRLMGAGAFADCRAHVYPLLNKTVPCSEPPCLFNGVHTPEIDYHRHRFVGVSEWWYSMHDVLGLGGVYGSEKYHSAAEHFCQLDWDHILAEHSAGRLAAAVTEQQLRLQCFKAAWLSSILHEGFGMPTDDSSASVISDSSQKAPMFQSMNNANGIPFSWTLGAAMMHAVSPVEVGSVVSPAEAATLRHWWTTTWRASADDSWPPADASPLLPWVWLTLFIGYFVLVLQLARLIRRIARKQAVMHLGYL